MYLSSVFLALLFVATAYSSRPARYWDDEACGQSKYEDAGREQGANGRGRIVGGWEAREHEFPWQISLKWMGSHSCGGWLIDERHVVTAAHCTKGYPKEEFTVVVGQHDRDQDNPNKQEIAIEDYFEHDDYDNYTLEADICVILLAESVEFNEDIQPICPPSMYGVDDYAGTHAPVSGWGSMRSPDGGPNARVLHYVNLLIISDERCKEDEYVGHRILPDMICAWPGLEDGDSDRDSCYGDSGGPLMYITEDGRFEVIGIVSWGYRCADYAAGVYVRVSYYVDWIRDQMARNYERIGH